jgi:Family of unknown function (DUF5947)
MESLASPRLQRLAQRPAAQSRVEPPLEECELCGRSIPPEHRHVLDLENRNLLCACRACAVLLDRRAAGGGHWRLVPERRLRLDEFRMPDEHWETLNIPVDMAFFFNDTSAGRVVAYYPSPMGPTESALKLESWDALEEANDILRSLEPDVEALLVNRARGQRRQWLVPIEDCYALVGLIRGGWRGLTGGAEVWRALAGFFEELDRRARPAGRNDDGRSG